MKRNTSSTVKTFPPKIRGRSTVTTLIWPAGSAPQNENDPVARTVSLRIAFAVRGGGGGIPFIRTYKWSGHLVAVTFHATDEHFSYAMVRPAGNWRTT